MSNILITGGNGLVGSQFIGDNYYRCSSKEVDLRNRLHVEKLFESNNFEGVIHCAAKVGGLGANMSYKGEFFYDNIMINTNVVECARIHGVKHLVGFMSTCIFPDNTTYPLTEKMIHLGEPHTSNYAYAYAKRMLDVQIRSYREQYGIKYTSVVPTNIYGPNDNFSLTDGHVIPTLIHKMYLAQLTDTPMVIWGTGNPLREFIYSKDVAILTQWIMNNYDDSEPVILSPSEEISIKDIVYILVDEFKFRGDIIFDKTKNDGQLRKPSDNSKLKGIIPQFEFTPIRDGIRETVTWFKNNYNISRK